MATENTSHPISRISQNRASRRLSKRAVPVREMEAENEKQNSQTVDTLNRQLDQKANELRIARERLVKRDLESKEFVNAMSHDLRAPLRAISGFSDYLKDEYKDSLDQTANDYIERIADGASRMELLITGLVKYARVPLKAVPDEVVDLNDLLEDALAALHEQISAVGAVVTYDSLPKMHGDYAQLTCLLQNLIENGLKFNESEIPTVQIGFEKIDENFVLCIQDNGIGITEKSLDCVFDLGRRLNLPEKFDGVGVGLSTARRIVEQYAGKIWLKSEEGVGTRAFISLPNVCIDFDA